MDLVNVLAHLAILVAQVVLIIERYRLRMAQIRGRNRSDGS